MTDKQIEVIVKLDNLVKPLADKVKELKELCQNPRRVVARDFLGVYQKELNEWMELRLMLMDNFQGKDAEMEIAKYKTRFGDSVLPEVVKEEAYEWDEMILDSP